MTLKGPLAETLTRDFEKPRRTPVYLSPGMRDKFHKRVVEDGYGLRGKNLWMEDTIWWFTNPDLSEMGPLGGNNAWKALVCYSAVFKGKLVQEHIALSPELHRHLWKCSLEASLYGIALDPPIHIDPSLSAVMRAAIVWRLEKPIGWRPKGADTVSDDSR